MAINIATAFVEIRPDTRKGAAETKQQVKDMAQEATKTLAQFFSAAVVVNEFRKVIGAASDLEQAVGGTQAIFGKAQGAVNDFATTSAKSFGISERAARELTTQIGGLLNGLGFTQEESAKTSVELSKLGADLAATFGGKPEEAVQALGAALRGEFNPLERFGVSLRQSQINLKAVEMGLAESTGAVDQNARAMATLALITEQTAAAQGQAGREQDTAAGRAVRFTAQLEDMRAKLGDALLPTFVRAVDILTTLVNVFSALPAPVQTAVVVLVALVALAGPMATLAATIKAVGLAIASANPYLLALGAAVAAAAGLMIAFQNRAASNAQAVKDLADAMSAANDEAEGMVSWLNQIAADADFMARVLGDAGVTTQEVADAALAGGDAWSEMREKLLAANDASGEAAIVQDLVRNAIDQLPQTAQEAADKVDLLGRVQSDTADSADGLAGSTENLGGELVTIERNASSARSAFDDLDDAVSRLNDAFDDIIGRSMDLDEAQQRLYENAQALTEAIDENGATLDINTEAGRKNRDQIRENVTAILDNAAALVRSGKSNQEAAIAVELQRQALVDQMIQAGFTREQVEDYLTTLGLTPENVTTAIETANVEASKARVDEMIAKLGEIPETEATEIQALIDAGLYAEAERQLNALARSRSVFFNPSTGRTFNGPAATGTGIATAEGGYFTGRQTRQVADAGAEAVLPLTKPSRLAKLLDDERISDPIVDALGGSQGGASSGVGGVGFGPGTSVTLVVDGNPFRAMIVAHEREQVAELMAGVR